MMERWERVDALIAKIETYLLTALTTLMILLAFFQILLRNVWSTGFAWGDPCVRYLVLWVGFIGAAIAVRQGKHIRIDVFSRWMSGWGHRLVLALVHLFSFFVCGLLTYTAVVFTRNEFQMGDSPILGIPAWGLQAIIPLTLGVMTIRYGFQSYATVRSMFTPNLLEDLQKQA